MRFHHLAYAVKDIREFLASFFQPIFSPLSVTEIVPDPNQRVSVCFAQMAGGVTIELVEPMGEDSPLNSLIGSRRGGLYHVCYEVDDLGAEIKRFRSNGGILLGRPLPAAAFNGRKIVFLLTPQKDIVELLESAPRS